MFHDFIGKPSTSEGLSLAAINQSLVQILQWYLAVAQLGLTYMLRCSVMNFTVLLIYSEHMSVISLFTRWHQICGSGSTYIGDHLEGIGW